MDKKVLSIYVNLQDEKIDLPSYLNDSKFIISICPSSVTTTCGKLTRESIKKVEDLLDRGCLLGQRGFSGRCIYTHRRTDPWHEDFCLYNPPIEWDLQLEFMSRGKRILMKTFGKSPDVYAPINHLYDENTLRAARWIGYKFVMDQSNTLLSPYYMLGLVIIPESKIGKNMPKSEGIYSHASELNEKLSSDLVGKINLVSPEELTPLYASEVSEYKITLNEFQKRAKKYARDLRNIILSYTKK